MLRAGLITKRYRGPGDMFRGRIMFPLQDAGGRVIGFTARIIEDDPNAPKYINTPQTLLYDKGRHIYGLHLAKEAIRKNKYVVMVEGNLDVIAAHQAGTKQVVATAGTALTEMHLKGISRFTGDIRLAFDEDKAGQAATERAIPIASKVGVGLSIITIPEGKDPDELIKKDVQAWVDIIDKPQYALDWLIERYQKELDLDSAVGKKQFSDVLLTVVRTIQDSVEQDHYVQVIADLIGVSKEALLSKLNQKESTTRVLKKSKVEPRKPEVDTENIKFQDRLLAVCLMQPALRSYLKPITIEMLATEQAQKLVIFLQTHPDFSGDPKEAAALKDIGDYAKILSLQFEELYQGLELLELRNEVARMQVRVIEHYVKKQKHILALQMSDASDEEGTKLLEQAKALDQLLKTHKGGA